MTEDRISAGHCATEGRNPLQELLSAEARLSQAKVPFTAKTSTRTKPTPKVASAPQVSLKSKPSIDTDHGFVPIPDPNLISDIKVSITNLPTEIKIQIFKLLEPITSICLGLACKELYLIHKSCCGEKLFLNQFIWLEPKNLKYLPLHELLKEWAGPDLVYSRFCPGKFVPKEHTSAEQTLLVMATRSGRKSRFDFRSGKK